MWGQTIPFFFINKDLQYRTRLMPTHAPLGVVDPDTGPPPEPDPVATPTAAPAEPED